MDGELLANLRERNFLGGLTKPASYCFVLNVGLRLGGRMKSDVWGARANLSPAGNGYQFL